MGADLLKFYTTKVKREWKIAFWAAVILGLLIHTYKFTNMLLNHDALFNYYGSQNMLGSGRWLLSLSCGLSSYFNLPWLIGVMSVLFIALTAVVIVDIFKAENPVLIAVISGLIVSFPAITDTFYFEFTADGYMMAMFLAAVSVKLSAFEEKEIWKAALSAVCICCACAIYQAYVSFALVLALTYFIVEAFDGKRTNREVAAWALKEIAIYISAMAGYYVIWKLFLLISGEAATTYLGMDKIGQMSLGNIAGAIGASAKNFVLFFLEWNIMEHGFTAWNILNILFLTFGIATLITAVFKSGLYKRKLQFVLGLAAGCAIPFVVYIWLFASPEVKYSTRMEQSVCFCYILIAILAEKYVSPKRSSVVGLLLSALIFYNAVAANVFYYYMERCSQQSYAAAIELSTRLHELDDGSIQYLCIGGGLETWEDEDYLSPEVLGSLGKLKAVDKNLLMGSTNVSLYLMKELGFELSYYKMNEDAVIPVRDKSNGEPVANGWTLQFPLVSAEEKSRILQTEEYKNAPCWPSANSIFVMDQTIVVKLS